MRQKIGKQKLNIKKHFNDDNRVLFFMFNLRIFIQIESDAGLNNLRLKSNVLTICIWMIIISSFTEIILSFFN